MPASKHGQCLLAGIRLFSASVGGEQSVHLSKAPGVRRWGILGLSQDLLPDICKGRVLALIPEL